MMRATATMSLIWNLKWHKKLKPPINVDGHISKKVENNKLVTHQMNSVYCRKKDIGFVLPTKPTNVWQMQKTEESS